MYTDSTSVPLYITTEPEMYYRYLGVGTGKKCTFFMKSQRLFYFGVLLLQCMTLCT